MRGGRRQTGDTAHLVLRKTTRWRYEMGKKGGNKGKTNDLEKKKSSPRARMKGSKRGKAPDKGGKTMASPSQGRRSRFTPRAAGCAEKKETTKTQNKEGGHCPPSGGERSKTDAPEAGENRSPGKKKKRELP